MRIKIGIIATRGEPGTLEQARGHFAGHGDTMRVSAGLYTLGDRLNGRYPGRTDTVD
ncbi:hypothetical protein TKWG_11945 [Advenella kashmirensis WT001]|uniref:Uncharacterized protein n=1 Tax=Advenella kashmirensis (strain DSM 17095 / LMG 22695 / WT001) TaxID=1036672 RepID=I3UC33_ADVKW|nr:hypothetical protein TKWG_11945 [Advenella kashmirensis WT001]